MPKLVLKLKRWWMPSNMDRMIGQMRFELNKISKKPYPTRDHRMGLTKMLWARKDRWIPLKKKRRQR